MLSRLAQQFAAEIAQHDWSDAPYRADRAGHDRSADSNRGGEHLTPKQADVVRLNVIWVTSQVLAYNDPNFDIVEFARAAGDDSTPKGWLDAGLRGAGGEYDRPGTYLTDSEAQDPNSVGAIVTDARATTAKVKALVDEINEVRTPS